MPRTHAPDRPSRLQGPGGLYTIGNVIGLATAAAAMLFGADILPGGGWTTAAPLDAAVLLALSYALFLYSGEVYHRAWGPSPDPGLVRLADGISAVGALLLAVSLSRLGHLQMAVGASLVHAAARAGSALAHGPVRIALPGLPAFDPFRVAVVASRLPAIADLTLFVLWTGLAGTRPVALALAGVLIVRLVLCVAADWMLVRMAAAPDPSRPRTA